MAQGKPNPARSNDDIRKEAEHRICESEEAKALSAVEAQRLVHELRVHQVELEMQNEDLRMQREQLEALHNKYLDLYDFAPVSYISVDAGGIIREINLAGAQLLGQYRNQLIEKSLSAFIFIDDRDKFRAFYRSAFQSQIRETCELRLNLIPNRTINVELVGRVVVTPGVTEKLLRIAVFDITERAKLEQEREQFACAARASQQQAEAANRAKDEFLAILSHELRTPLTPMMGWTRLLRGKNVDAAFTAKGLEVIDRNILAQARLVDDLLDVSRIVAGKLSLYPADVELGSLLDQVIESERANAAAKQIEIQYKAAPGDYPVRCDLDRLRQVLINLIGNAIKFTPLEGVINVTLSQSGGQAVLTVSDTGIGIASDELPHIFERFRQADHSITRRFKGLGLGLSIVRHLVTAHGGSVEAESAGTNRGAKFTVKFPLLKTAKKFAAPEFPKARKNKGALDLSGINILLVEDEQDTATVLALGLQGYGAKVQKAANVWEALALFDQAPPDVLLSDIGLPERDGLQLIHDVRARPAGRGVPAIALTAYADPKDQFKALECGFHIHLVKPVELNILADVIRNMVVGAR
ncbi:MAG TPA: ATP-binding protein [Planctomycetota bacterium]|nr:ATP-binding protein [Planctomycetota bacterium]